jgi:hypothetical protein
MKAKMLKQMFEDGDIFTVNKVEFEILSVGHHETNGQSAGFSYSFRPKPDLEIERSEVIEPDVTEEV